MGNLSIHTGIFFRKVGYTRYDVVWFAEWINFTRTGSESKTLEKCANYERRFGFNSSFWEEPLPLLLGHPLLHGVQLIN
jgi:hypothetical protein